MPRLEPAVNRGAPLGAGAGPGARGARTSGAYKDSKQTRAELTSTAIVVAFNNSNMALYSRACCTSIKHTENDMAKLTRPPNRGHVVKWVDICRSLRMLGHMKDYSKGECLRINKLLNVQIAAGRVEKVARGRYRRIIPENEIPLNFLRSPV